MKQEEKKKPSLEDIIREGLRSYREKEESAIIDELSRLSKEGHILIIQLAPTMEKTEDGFTFRSALKITLPKYEDLKAKLEKACEALRFYSDYQEFKELPRHGEHARQTLKEIERSHD